MAHSLERCMLHCRLAVVIALIASTSACAGRPEPPPACKAEVSASVKKTLPKSPAGSVQASSTKPPVRSADAGAVTAGGAAQSNPCEPELFPGTPLALGISRFQDASGDYGFKDARGRVVIPARYSFAYEFNENGIAAVIVLLGDHGVRPMFIDTNGNKIAEAYFFDNGPDYFVDGFSRIVGHGKIGFMDRRGKVVIPPRYDFAWPMCAGRSVVCVGCRVPKGDADIVGGRWGIIDSAGNWVLEPEYDTIAPRYDGGTILVARGGRSFFVDTDGRPIKRA